MSSLQSRVVSPLELLLAHFDEAYISTALNSSKLKFHVLVWIIWNKYSEWLSGTEDAASARYFKVFTLTMFCLLESVSIRRTWARP
jgi:hypothetical protein